MPGVMMRAGVGPRALAFAFGLMGAGCSGKMLIPPPGATPCAQANQCNLGFVCNFERQFCEQSPGPCSTDFPQGDCARGQECLDGKCRCTDPAQCHCPPAGCPVEWNCDVCTATQACVQGRCEDVVVGPGANSCALERPEGLCAGSRPCCVGVCCPVGEVCVGGHCAPNVVPCSLAHPDGWCDENLACFGGRCMPREDCSCSPSNVTGCCPAGEECQSGACAPVACAPGVPGVCPLDHVCGANGCERLPCSPQHTAGACAGATFCSGIGGCIPSGECRVNVDCRNEGSYCATGNVCRSYDDCDVDADCEVLQAVRFGQGFQCVSGDCSERLSPCEDASDCIPGKYCSLGDANGVRHCLAPPSCDRDADCASGTELCGSGGTCIAVGTCQTDLDCRIAGEFCGSKGHCMPRLTCWQTVPDCPDSHTCQGATPTETGTCVPVDPGECTSNNWVTTGCAVGALVCCGAGGTCCANPQERCSAAANCIPAGRCVDDTDCLEDGGSLYTRCIGYTCVPVDSCPCAAGEKCARVQAAGGAYVLGCIPAERCATSKDCPLGELCDSSYHCQAAPGCDNEVFDAGGVVPPNVLIVVDRSGSMQICGPDDPAKGYCGYNRGVCTDHAHCQPDTCMNPSGQLEAGVCQLSNPKCTVDADCLPASSECNNPTGELDKGQCVYELADACTDLAGCAPLPDTCNSGKCFDLDCAAGVNGETTTRWTEALAAIDFIAGEFAGRINFGLSIFPRPHRPCTVNTDCRPVVGEPCNQGKCMDGCTTPCNFGSCLGGSNLVAGVIDVPVDLPGTPDDKRAAIMAALGATAPGGSTPTAPTLRYIDTLAGRGGLDATDRANAILLITDGEAIGDGDPVSACQPPCGDGAKNGDETDVDCGGSCPPCAAGGECQATDDCASGICRGGTCRPVTCGNGAVDGDETDVDCGGACGGCAPGLLCWVAQDCATQVCAAGLCALATCGDGAKNGDETDVDCGGACVAVCDAGEGCVEGADCAAGLPCQVGRCRPDHCDSGSHDGNETAVDCGGDCGPCVNGSACVTDGDCASGWCNATVCATHACKNGIKDGSETDVDCGGSSCPPCGPYRACNSAHSNCAGVAPECRSYAPYTNDAAKANAAIGRLYAESPRIKTFVVGFNFLSSNLNCNAVHGRTARDQGNCAQVTSETCSTANAACFYDAANQSGLQVAFDEILTKVSSCRYDMTGIAIPNYDALYAYFEDADGGNRQRVQRYVGWDLVDGALEFFGSACDTAKAGVKKPRLVLGCAGTGG